MVGYSYHFWHGGMKNEVTQLYRYQSSAQELTNEEIKSFKNIQHNQLPYETLVTSQVPSSQTEHKEGEKVAMLNIPKLKKRFSIYWGADDATLKKGVGMFVSDVTTTPSGGGHTVLSGHRDTVFTDLGQLKEKDTLVLEYDNKTYTYEIQKIWITHADDRTVIIKKEEPILTLTTCYPFDYIGDAPDRYIIEAKLTGSYSK